MEPLATYDDLSARDIPSTSRTDADLASASAAVREAALDTRFGSAATLA